MNVPLIPMLFHIIEQPVRKFMSQKMAPTAAPGVYSYSCRPLRSLFVLVRSKFVRSTLWPYRHNALPLCYTRRQLPGGPRSVLCRGI